MDVNVLKHAVRSGLDDGHFAMMYLWISFWANGGSACRADLEAFAHGRQELSGNDALVLEAVVNELGAT